MNLVILNGNLGADAELTITQSGVAICRMRLATTEKFQNSAGEKQEKTSWHRVTLFGKRGEALSKYLKKGDKIAIQGRIEYSSYEKDGATLWSTDIVANDVELLGGKKGESTDSHERDGAPKASAADDFPV